MSDDPRILVLTEMRKQTDLLQRILAAVSGAPVAPAPTNDRICDGPYGDPVIKAKDPKDWCGEPMTGRTFSQCPAEYLDLLAERYDYFASKETDQKKAGYNVKDAQRARAWAARIRAGYTPPVAPVTEQSEGEPTW